MIERILEGGADWIARHLSPYAQERLPVGIGRFEHLAEKGGKFNAFLRSPDPGDCAI